jgi:salicylate hydroxylase
MYMDVKEQLAAKRGEKFTSGYVKGLPVGLKLPSGIVRKIN